MLLLETRKGRWGVESQVSGRQSGQASKMPTMHGATKKNPQINFRSMKRILGTLEGAPEINWMPIPLASGSATPLFLLPREFFRCLLKELGFALGHK